MPKEPESTSAPNVVNSGYKLALILSACITPISRAKGGVHAHAGPGLFSLILMFAWSGFGNLHQLLYYLPFWLLMVIFRRWTSDPNVISRYMGYPWIVMRAFPFLGEGVATILEAVIVIGAGLLLKIRYPPLGIFVLSVGTGLLVKEVIDRAVISARIRQMRDAELLQRGFVDDYRKF